MSRNKNNYISITAVFIGSDSLGYETGRPYRLKVLTFGSMVIRRVDGSGKCPYSSLSAFLRNWTDIKTDLN